MGQVRKLAGDHDRRFHPVRTKHHCGLVAWTHGVINSHDDLISIESARKTGLRMPVFNPDGISVKGCSYIYAPFTRARSILRWLPNPYRGCGHGCTYCYVPHTIKIERSEFDAGAIDRPDYLGKLATDAKKYQAHGAVDQVMISTTGDPYHPRLDAYPSEP